MAFLGQTWSLVFSPPLFLNLWKKNAGLYGGHIDIHQILIYLLHWYNGDLMTKVKCWVKYEVNKKLKTPVTLLQQDQASFH